MKKKTLSIIVSMILSSSIFAVDFNIQVNPLHYAVSINESDYVYKLIKDEPKLASQFDKDGLTPLHVAINKNSIKSLKLILEEKINPNIKNSNNETLLVYAIKQKNINAINLLLKYGAKKDVKDNSGLDANDYAKKSQKNIKIIFFKEVKEVKKTIDIKTDLNLKHEKNEIEKIKSELNNKILEIEKNTDKKIDLINDLIKTNNNILSGTIEQLKNEISLLKLENQSLILNSDKLESELAQNYKKTWENEVSIKEIKEENSDLKRKQLMGIYSESKNSPEKQPILDIKKEAILINQDNDDEKMELPNSKLEEVIIKGETNNEHIKFPSSKLEEVEVEVVEDGDVEKKMTINFGEPIKN